MESETGNGVTLLWIDDNGFLEKTEEAVFIKSMKIGEFIMIRSAPLHHPPHKVRAWLSLLKNSADYRDHFNASKLLDRKMTFEQLEISPGAIILFEKQSIDSEEWFLEKLHSGQTVAPEIFRNNPEPVVPKGINPQLYTQSPVFPDKLTTPTPTQQRPTHQPIAFVSPSVSQHYPHSHFDPMMSQFNIGHILSSFNPSHIPMQDPNFRHRLHHGGGPGSAHGDIELNLAGEDKQIQEVILKSIQQAKAEEETRKQEEKNNKKKKLKLKRYKISLKQHKTRLKNPLKQY